VLVADGSIRTLAEVGRKRTHRGERGTHGLGKGKHGARGKDAVLRVPVGTQVRRLGDGELLADLDAPGESVAVARGGLGGRGNAWFKRSDYQAPRIAQRGQAGEEVEVQLDLKLLADVGIVGLPNAGKSTLLRAMSGARPKVADYPFTTLEAALGVVDVGYERFVMADIPGLIEGAHEGAGLGLDFLRHVERTKVLVHLVDGSRPDPLADIAAIDGELREYAAGLEEKPQLVAVNKVDLPEVAALAEGLADRIEEARGDRPLLVSAAERRGTDELASRLAEMLAAAARQPSAEEPPPVIRPRPLGRGVEVREEDGAFRVDGERVAAFAEMMPLELEEGRQEFWWRLGRWGVSGALRRAGAEPGALVRLGKLELEWPG
jgi:GTP-binding protein